MLYLFIYLFIIIFIFILGGGVGHVNAPPLPNPPPTHGFAPAFDVVIKGCIMYTEVWFLIEFWQACSNWLRVHLMFNHVQIILLWSWPHPLKFTFFCFCTASYFKEKDKWSSLLHLQDQTRLGIRSTMILRWPGLPKDGARKASLLAMFCLVWSYVFISKWDESLWDKTRANVTELSDDCSRKPGHLGIFCLHVFQENIRQIESFISRLSQDLFYLKIRRQFVRQDKRALWPSSLTMVQENQVILPDIKDFALCFILMRWDGSLRYKTRASMRQMRGTLA